MSHIHTGPEDYACDGCIRDANTGGKLNAADELRARRFWGWMIVGFSLALAAVSSFVLWRIGSGR